MGRFRFLASGPRALGRRRAGGPSVEGPRAGAGTERDPGKVDWVQAGRTIRTPTFTLTRGRLFYWVRGGATPTPPSITTAW